MEQDTARITTRVPDTLLAASIRWMGNYNAIHSNDLRFVRLTMSDVVRFSIQAFISSMSPNKFFAPRD